MPSATAIRFNQLATIERFDSKNGVMTVTAIARTPGILTYRNADGSTRRELVSREFLRRVDSDGVPIVAQLANLPVTREHPPCLLRNDADLLKKYQVGKTQNRVHVFDDGQVQVTFDVYDAETQDDIRFGRKDGVSVGYETALRNDAGEWHGQTFDALQDEPVRKDHMAVCETPRAAGAKIKTFKFDSADTTDIAWQVDSVEPQQSALADQHAQIKGKQNMTHTVTVGNYPIVLDSANEAAAINAMLAENSELKAKLDSKKKGDEDDDWEDEDDDWEDEDDEEMKDKNGKPLPAFIKKKIVVAKKDAADAAARADELAEKLDAANAEITILNSLVEGERIDSGSEERLDADEIEARVQSGITERLDALEDCRPLLPTDFKFDSSMSAADLKLAAIKHFDSDISVEGDVAIDAAYQTIKRVAGKRTDSSQTLNGALFQTLPTPTAARQDSRPLAIHELARLDSDDPRLASLDFRTKAQVASYRIGRAPITPGAN